MNQLNKSQEKEMDKLNPKKWIKNTIKQAIFNLVVTITLILGTVTYNLHASQLDRAKNGLIGVRNTILEFIRFVAIDILCPVFAVASFVVALIFGAMAWKDVTSGAGSKKNSVIALFAIGVGVITGTTTIWNIFFS
jgi:hypothetical protein